MFTGLEATVAFVGTKAVVAIAAGAVAVLVGLAGFAWLLASASRPDAGRGGGRRGRRLAGSTLLMVVGGAVILVSGVVAPIGAVRARLASVVYVQNRRIEDLHAMNRESLARNEQLLARIAEAQAQQAHLSEVALKEQVNFGLRGARAQSEQVIKAILDEPHRQDPRRLNRHESKSSSQNGEDGIIAEIFRRIGTTNRHFVEFGASSGLENNTALLVRQGWSGLWIDADTAAIAVANETFRPEVEAGRLTVLEAFIDAENIESLFARGGVPEEPDLLSIDIDRNDYHVWEAITNYRPRVVVIEYNAGLPPSVSWVVPYDPKAYGWTSVGTGNGASLKALEELGAEKGYSLVGCDLCGVNAFFIRDDLLGDHFAAPYTAENHHEPFRYPYITR